MDGFNDIIAGDGTGAPGAAKPQTLSGEAEVRGDATVIFATDDDIVLVGLDTASKDSDDFYGGNGKGWISHITSESGEKVYFNILGFELDEAALAAEKSRESIADREDDILPDTAIETADWFEHYQGVIADTSSGLEPGDDAAVNYSESVPELPIVHDNAASATDFQFA